MGVDQESLVAGELDSTRGNGAIIDMAHYQDVLAALASRYRNLQGKSLHLLFSGGLDTSFLAHFLTSVVGAKVTALRVDVGSAIGRGDDGEIERRAAVLHVPLVRLDGRQYLEELLRSCISAEGQLFRGHHPASSLSRVAISRAVSDYSREHRPDAIMHGSNGYQNNAFRFFNGFARYGANEDHTISLLAPNLHAGFERGIAEHYLQTNGIEPLRRHGPGTYSEDDNLFGLEMEDAGLAEPSHAFSVEEALLRHNVPHCGDIQQSVSIQFRDGLPVAFGSSKSDLHPVGALEILEELNRIGLQHRVGIYDYYEGRPTGAQAREVHIAPGMTILIRARHLLRTALSDAVLNRELERLSSLWSEMVIVTNLWTHPLRESADVLLRRYGNGLDGTVTLRLGRQFIDTPEVFVNRKSAQSHSRRVTMEQVSSLYDRVHGVTPVRPTRSDFEDIREMATAIDDVIRATYEHFIASAPSMHA